MLGLVYEMIIAARAPSALIGTSNKYIKFDVILNALKSFFTDLL